MKIFIDNNLPQTLVKALHTLIAPDHECVHLRDKFSENVSDLEWIEVLTKEGGWVILSQDKFTKSNKMERKALAKSGLVVYLLSGKGWAKLKSLKKNLAILEWTESLLDHAEPALKDAKSKGIGSAWSICYKANNRKYNIKSESLN